ncbi:complement component 1 Q subcomponent-binding protein, mitochondrial [Anabrus simplex]|uniref:complement component 1 Q subcomponent-binding protein, mitochondrial n=1 Tax=Anabrus simplex TaxID=316456 RepID=UPI0034DD152A
MNKILTSVLRISSKKCLPSPFSQAKAANSVLDTTKRQLTRTLWHMCSTRNEDPQFVGGLKLKHPSNVCGCGCGMLRIHTKGEKELVEFLSEEIAAERKLQKIKTIPTQVDDFSVRLDGSEVTLTKKAGDEEISINFNVNHTVDAEAEAEINPNMDKPEFADMKSKPSFEVDIKRGSQTLSFSCSFTGAQSEQQSEEGYNDIFGIDEVTLFEGEWTEKTYAVSGDVLDGYLYDLLMNLLEEKGVSNEFVEKLSDLSTAYEHSSYIAMLENVQKFLSGK